MAPQHPRGGAARSFGDGFGAGRARPPHALDPNDVSGSELMRRVIESLPAVAYRCRLDADRTVEFMSLGCRTITGCEAADLVGNRVTSFARLIHVEDLPRVQEVLKASARANQPFELTYRIARVDGRLAPVREVGYGVREAGEVVATEGLITALNRPTDRELELLTLDVAHDLNNALGAIKTTAELSQLEARDRTIISDLGDIIAAAARAGTLVERLRRGLAGRPDPTRGAR